MKTLPVSELLKQLPDHIVATFFDDSDNPAVHDIKYVGESKIGSQIYGADIVENERVVRAFVIVNARGSRFGGNQLPMFTGLTDETVKEIVSR